MPTVIGEIKRYLRDKTWSVHVPRRIKEIGPRIKKVSDELTNELERSPSISEIAERLEVTDEEVLEAMEMGQSYNALSVDHSIREIKMVQQLHCWILWVNKMIIMTLLKNE